MEKLMSATAVTKSKQGNSILATKEGLFIKSEGTWKRSLHYTGRTIRDLTCSNGHIYGVGDNGLFISSSDEGGNWVIKQFPTKATIWSVVAHSSGLVITHGEKVIYLSTNSGETWTTYYPYQFLNAPSIRSICLYKNKLLIGTKIHPKYGGVWCFDLLTQSMKQIKTEKQQMISSMITFDHQLIVATGSCRSDVGKIEICSLSHSFDQLLWETCLGNENQSFLDLTESDGIIYSTSTQNKAGISTISQVSVEHMQITPCNYIKGHGWRIWNEREDYIVAGLYESLEVTKSYRDNYVI
ncbi:hypothetical protein JOC85_002662 [Bacillus mesophilus]|uniref:Exo-alpha-sialidase n=1 Tax=Bacillus mesophilus TaxID=1808955 RepID=A0A6M0Q8U9_9BACI|nr:hypothetical protein [Bacillus mesophilus]MBM7661855.1 hypothetical protein [Bacillus mesophilus]NEY72782.1 hypothetical protein [Bacillus mesophilus]